MDYTLEKKSVPVREAVFDGCLEQPIDLDFTLPDYCPGIEKILKCTVTPKIHSKSLSGDRLTIDGAASVCVLYTDEEKNSVRSCEHSVPFSGSMTVRGDCSDAVVLASAKPDYVNCRAISPRRLDIHGAFSLCARVEAIVGRETAFSCREDDVQLRLCEEACSRLCALSQQQFNVSEELEPSAGSPNIRTILKSSVRVKSGECRIAGDKAMVKGEMTVRVLYIADNEIAETAVMEFTVPVGQVVDTPGIENDARTDYRLQLLSCDVRLKEDASSERGAAITVEARLCTYISAYCDEKIKYICDAFSTDRELETEYSQLQLSRLTDICRETCITKSSAELETNGISKVIDIWGEACTAEGGFENGSAFVKGKLCVCILALDNDLTPFYTERSVDYLCPLKLSEADASAMSLEAFSRADSVSYRISGGNTVDLRCEITVEARCYAAKSVRVLTAAKGDEEHGKKKPDDCALTLYYARKGESIWDIGRSYSARPDDIMRENEITEDALDSDIMLLIPGV
ncbi:MAG: SPOCS domain-containing protein [Acutalibacteraceae bacterium]